MLVPAVRMGEFGRFWDSFYLLVTSGIRLGWAIALTPLANHKHLSRIVAVRECIVEDQRCAQSALKVYIAGVLSPFINTDQCSLIIVGEEVGAYLSWRAHPVIYDLVLTQESKAELCVSLNSMGIG